MTTPNGELYGLDAIQLAEASPDALVGVNAGGVIVLANTRTAAMFGYSRDEMLGQSVEMLVPETRRGSHPGQRDGYFAHAIPRPMGAGLDLSGRRKDGSIFPALISLSPLQTPNGPVVLAAVRDITASLLPLGLNLTHEVHQLRSSFEKSKKSLRRDRYMLAALAMLTLGFGYNILHTTTIVRHNQKVNRATILDSCREANAVRKADLDLWKFVLDLPPQPGQASSSPALIATLKQEVARDFSPVNCSHR